MVNILLLLSFIAFLAFASFEQFVIPKRKGETLMMIPLKKGGKLDALLLLGILAIVLYQTGLNIDKFTLFLLSMLFLLSLYLAFFRQPRLLFKQQGLYFNSIFIDYQKLAHCQLTAKDYVFFDLKNGKRLSARLANAEDKPRIYAFIKGESQ